MTIAKTPLDEAIKRWDEDIENLVAEGGDKHYAEHIKRMKADLEQLKINLGIRSR